MERSCPDDLFVFDTPVKAENLSTHSLTNGSAHGGWTLHWDRGVNVSEDVRSFAPTACARGMCG